MSKLALALLLLFALPSHAYKIVLLTDQPNEQAAKDYAKHIKTQEPFKSIQGLEIEVAYVPASDLKCGVQIPGSTRSTTCDDRAAIMNGALRNADKTMVLFQSSTYLGSGGDVAVASTECVSKFKNCLIHEFFHTLGFADEYAYSAAEATYYCQGNFKKTNVVAIRPENPYSSDQVARQKHSGQIPWYGSIKPATLLTTGSNLGSSQANVIGLFRSNTCDSATPPVPTWKPGKELTIMGGDGPIPKLYQDAAARAMGVTLRQAAPEPSASGSNTKHE